MTAYGPDTEDVEVAPGDVPSGTPAALVASVADHRLGPDPLRPVRGAEFFLDVPGADGAGIPMAPVDGDWGGLAEAVEAMVDTSTLEPGRYYVLVHGQNDSGDWGPFTSTFLTITLGAAPEVLALAASAPSIPINSGQAAITATLSLSDGTPSPGWVVTFTTDLGAMEPPVAYSGGDGQAFATLHAGPVSGTATVTSRVAALVETVTVTLVAPPTWPKVFLPLVLRPNLQEQSR
jgi:hypothetical protein